MNAVKLSGITISNSDWLVKTLVSYSDNDVVSFSPQIDQLTMWLVKLPVQIATYSL